MSMLQKIDLYPLIDALGLKLFVRETSDGNVRFLVQDKPQFCSFVVKALTLAMKYEVTVLESVLNPHDEQTSGVHARIAGNLHLVMTFDHKRTQLDAYVLDGQYLPKGGVFERRWSRQKFFEAIAPALVAHYSREPVADAWEQTPRAPQWADNYLQFRKKLNLTSSEAMELAEAVAWGVFDADEKDLRLKFLGKTRDEIRDLVDDAKGVQS